MRLPAIAGAVSCCVLAAAGARAPDDTWRLAREGGDVSVYTRDVEGSRFVESLARTVVEARLSTVTALIWDVDNHAQWIDTIVESRRLETVSPTEAYIYSRSAAPWPASERDAVTLTRLEQDPGSLAVSIRSTGRPDRIPPREGVVRVAEVTSSWTLVPLPGGRVEVTYRVHHDPGGELPGWLVNSLTYDQPYRTLVNLRRVVEGESRYRDAVLPYVREPGG